MAGTVFLTHTPCRTVEYYFVIGRNLRLTAHAAQIKRTAFTTAFAFLTATLSALAGLAVVTPLARTAVSVPALPVAEVPVATTFARLSVLTPPALTAVFVLTAVLAATLFIAATFFTLIAVILTCEASLALGTPLFRRKAFGTLCLDTATGGAECILAAFEYHIFAQLTVETAVVEGYFLRRRETDVVEINVLVADNPCMITGENMFEHFAD